MVLRTISCLQAPSKMCHHDEDTILGSLMLEQQPHFPKSPHLRASMNRHQCRDTCAPGKRSAGGARLDRVDGELPEPAGLLGLGCVRLHSGHPGLCNRALQRRSAVPRPKHICFRRLQHVNVLSSQQGISSNKHPHANTAVVPGHVCTVVNTLRWVWGHTCHLRTICSAFLTVSSWLEICLQGSFMRCTIASVATAASGLPHTRKHCQIGSLSWTSPWFSRSDTATAIRETGRSRTRRKAYSAGTWSGFGRSLDAAATAPSRTAKPTKVAVPAPGAGSHEGSQPRCLLWIVADARSGNRVSCTHSLCSKWHRPIQAA